MTWLFATKLMLQVRNIQVNSGGQTGIDQLSLEIAKSLGIPTGGMAPKNYKTETGNNPLLAEAYGLTESTSTNYYPRTRHNIEHSDLTVVLGDVSSPGSRATVRICHEVGKPVLQNPTAMQLWQQLNSLQVQTLNVAGNRASKLTPARLELARTVLTLALRMWASGDSYTLAL